MTTAIVGLLGVIVGAVLTALLNFYLQRAADKHRWEREDEVQRQHWEREDKAALRAERISLYREYLAQAHQVRDALGFNEDEMHRMMYEIELLGSDEVSGAAIPLYFNAVDVWRESHMPLTLEELLEDHLGREVPSFSATVLDVVRSRTKRLRG